MVLAILAAFEEMVVDTNAALYPRAFAWYRLFRHWSSLRWDDTQALSPHSLQRRARGVVGNLERTKTSGPGKAAKALPVFVSQDAWLVHEWLDVGLAIWQKEPFCYKRDYFLPLPGEALAGVTKRRALYTDAQGFSLGLMASLTGPDGLALLPPGGPEFWSEHSDRSGLDSWCAALGFEKSQRNFLGRWAAKGSSDIYVRTALRITENLQKCAAKHAKEAFQGGPDYFGEEEVLQGFTAHLQSGNSTAQAAKAATERLRRANYALDPTLDLNTAVVVREQAAPHGIDPEEVIPDVEEDAALDEALKQAAAPPAEDKAVPWGFVVSITRNGRHRKLHHIGDCRYVPGIHYHEFEIWGSKLPTEREIHSRCGWCFPSEKPGARVEEEPGSDRESDSSSSSSTGSSSGSPRGKRPKA